MVTAIAAAGGVLALGVTPAQAAEPAKPSISGTPPEVAVIGEPFSYQFTVEGADRVTVVTEWLPTGLTYDTSTSTLSGTPEWQATGAYSYSIIARNAVDYEKVTFDLELVPDRVVTSTSDYFKGDGTYPFSLSCPASHPYLLNQPFNLGVFPVVVFLPNGVDLHYLSRPAGLAYAVGHPQHTNGYVTGVQDLEIEMFFLSVPKGEYTDWTINLHCTKHIEEAYA